MRIGEALKEISANNVTLAEKQQQVYDAGVAEGFDAGRQAEYDAFWDSYQENGGEKQGLYLFAGSGWTDRIYNPKYPLQIRTNANSMYYGSKITNTKVPIDVTACNDNVYMLFAYSDMETIPLLTLGENNGTTANPTLNIFQGCTKLKNITIGGVIMNSIDLRSSTLLTKASITSFISALSTTQSGAALTFSKTAVNNAFEGGSTGSEWLDLIATKPGWTISLV